MADFEELLVEQDTKKDSPESCEEALSMLESMSGYPMRTPETFSIGFWSTLKDGIDGFCEVACKASIPAYFSMPLETRNAAKLLWTRYGEIDETLSRFVDGVYGKKDSDRVMSSNILKAYEQYILNKGIPEGIPGAPGSPEDWFVLVAGIADRFYGDKWFDAATRLREGLRSEIPARFL